MALGTYKRKKEKKKEKKKTSTLDRWKKREKKNCYGIEHASHLSRASNFIWYLSMAHWS